MKGLVIDVINMTISSLEDRGFLLQLKKIINGIISEEPEVQDVKKYVGIILNKDITDKREAIAELDDMFDSSITSRVNLNGNRYSIKYRQDFLKNLNVEKFISTVDQYMSEMSEGMTKLRSAKGDKAKSRLMDLINNSGKGLFDSLTNLRVSDGAAKSFVIDPNNKTITIENLVPVINQAKETDSTVIKTFPAFDIATYGGPKLGTSTLIAAKSGGFKSGTLQNICIYATMNNEPSKFVVPPGKVPAVFLVSMENTRRQLYQRHVSFFHESEDEAKKITENMSTDQIAMYISQLYAKHGVKLPIIYIDRVGMTTTVSDIAASIAEWEQIGYHPILLGIDYLTKLTPDDPVYRKYTDTGADGGKKQAKKSEEIRNYLYDRNIAGIVPEQLATDAVHIIESLRPDCRRVDPLFHTSMDMISGARNLSNEYENVIFIYKSEIANLEQNSDTITISEFLSMINKKTRETKTAYPLSPRDKISGPLYELQTKKLKNGPLREKIKDTGEVHVISPMINYRISDQDWAKSVRMYYTNDNVDTMSIKSLMEDSSRIITDVSDVFSNNDSVIASLGL